jgi:cytidylate kinase
MTARAITFAVQIGAGGFDIARQTAERLRYRYYDWEVTSLAAQEAGVSPEQVAAAEHHSSMVARIMERLSSASAYVVDDVDVSAPSPAVMDRAITALSSGDYRRFIERVVQELARQGEVVVVGHAGQVVLQREAGIFKVLINGSTVRRAERLAAEASIGVDEAMAAIQKSDRDRGNFFRQVYKVELLDPSLYDLTLNTDQLSTDAAVDLIARAAGTIEGFAAEAPVSEGTASETLA